MLQTQRSLGLFRRCLLLLLWALAPCRAFLLYGTRTQCVSHTHTRTHTPSPLLAASSAIATSTPPVVSAREELGMLLDTLASPTDMQTQQARLQRLDHVLTTLEQSFIPAQTIPFWALQNEGLWRHRFSTWSARKALLASSPSSPPTTDIHIEQHLRHLRGNKGTVQNIIRFSLSPDDPVDACLAGKLVVETDYEMDSRGMLEATSVAHELVPERLPQNPEALVKRMQACVPYDIFDPSPFRSQTTFADHRIRVTVSVSDRGSYRNVWERLDGGHVQQ